MITTGHYCSDLKGQHLKYCKKLSRIDANYVGCYWRMMKDPKWEESAHDYWWWWAFHVFNILIFAWTIGLNVVWYKHIHYVWLRPRAPLLVIVASGFFWHQWNFPWMMDIFHQIGVIKHLCTYYHYEQLQMGSLGEWAWVDLSTITENASRSMIIYSMVFGSLHTMAVFKDNRHKEERQEKPGCWRR
jgi:hypothetical protein